MDAEQGVDPHKHAAVVIELASVKDRAVELERSRDYFLSKYEDADLRATKEIWRRDRILARVFSLLSAPHGHWWDTVYDEIRALGIKADHGRAPLNIKWEQDS